MTAVRLALMLAASLPGASVARSVTVVDLAGQVTLAPGRVTFRSGEVLPLAAGRRVAAFQDGDARVAATVYRVTRPADPAMDQGRRLCGGLTGRPMPITFLAVWQAVVVAGSPPKTIIAPFTGRHEPASTAEPGSCGTYVYRW